jgi:hypothetical protein
MIADKLDENLNILDQELEKYSFDISHLTENDKDDIKHMYSLIWKTLNNKIFLENINDANVRIHNKIFVNNKEYGNYQISNKTTLHFINCKDTTIIINEKVCHITVERCENLYIKVKGGSITGLDDIKCKNIRHIMEDSSVYFIDLSSSFDCSLYISERNALNTIISSFQCPNVRIVMTDTKDGKIKNKYNPPLSFFEMYRLYLFEKANDTINLYYITPNLIHKRLIVGENS